MATKIDPRRIRTDLDTQIRVDWNEEAVKEYAELMERGVEFPPLLVFFDEPNNQFILADGFHRLAAHNRVKPNDFILVEQRLGDVLAARWAAIVANQSHGIRRTNNDKRNAVTQALLHPQGANKTDRSVAFDVGTSHTTVQNIRRELVVSGKICQIDSRIVQRGNQTYCQNTSQIGTNRSETNVSEEIPLPKPAPKPNIPAGTSRIKFGKVEIPAEATCMQCQHFEDQMCIAGVIENALPWNKACKHFEMQGKEPAPVEIAPPDYENAKPLGRTIKQVRKKRVHKNRDLKNCISVSLPSNNAMFFAVELRNHWEPPYLTECLAALKHVLEDEKNEN